MIRLLLLCLLLPSLVAQGAGVSSVSPNNAEVGSTLTVTMTLDASATPPPPPSQVQPTSMAIGGLSGSSISRTSNDCSATFTIPEDHPSGPLDCKVVFTTPNGEVELSLVDGFTVNAAPDSAPQIVTEPESQTVVLGDSVTFTVTATSSAPMSYQWQFDEDDIPGATSESYAIAIAALENAGAYQCVVSNVYGSTPSVAATLTVLDLSAPLAKPYVVVDTGQRKSYDNSSAITKPEVGEDFYGQDSNYMGNTPTYLTSADGTTVYDYHTGLTWTQTPDLNGDGEIDIDDKLTQSEAAAYVANLNAANYGGYNDWRLPSIKEIYSLMDFRGTDPTSEDTSTATPFIDTTYFDFGYGDTEADERAIDAQFATTSIYVDTVMNNQTAMFGLNLADGRIKGYPLSKELYALYCRGNTDYGVNDFVDNGDNTVTDQATGLMWQQTDSGSPMLWQAALAYAESSTHAGYDDWRLPNAKELQSLFDYSRSPGTTSSAAIDPIFSSTQITNEGGQVDYPWYFTGTTHVQQGGGAEHAVYLCFGRAIGYMNGAWIDVHGAGAQRSDPKTQDTTDFTYVNDGWYLTISPQGDAARWSNYVRLVRDAPEVDDGMPEVTLTTTTQTVSFDSSSIVIEGSHNENVSSITWSNALTGASGMVYLTGTTFTTMGIDLAMGDNTITITVANADGDEASEQIVVTRSNSFDGSIIYVDANTPAAATAQNGRSWDTAFEDLQDALALVDGQEIRVADGTYYPDEAAAGYATVSDEDRDSTFEISESVSLYGGYAGAGAVTPDERGYISILSGDLDNDDTMVDGLVVGDPASNTRNDNAYTVVTVRSIGESSPSLMDGFYITAGRADGGGVIVTQHGGALSLDEVQDFGINNCHFYGNYAIDEGGAIYMDLADATISNSSFVMNTAAGYGGAIQVEEADLTVSRCTFMGNKSEGAAGIYVNSVGTLWATNCLFSGHVTFDGGVVTTKGDSTIENCTIAGNFADDGAAGVLVVDGVLNVYNSLIAHNEDSGSIDTAGASMQKYGGTALVFNSLIRGSGGSSSWDASLGLNMGGNLDADPQFIDPAALGLQNMDGDYRILASSPANDAGSNGFASSGIDLNGDARVYNGTVDMGAYEQSHGIGLPVLTITNGSTRAVADPGSIDILGAAESVSGLITWENLETGDSGSFISATSWLLAGAPFAEDESDIVFTAENTFGHTSSVSVRIVNVGDVLFVDAATPAVLVDQDGLSWSTAYSDPQDAFDALLAGGTVWIAEGEYVPAIGESFELDADDVNVIGGFESGIAYPEEVDPENYPVVFDGDEEARLLMSVSSPEVRLSGIHFTNTNGSASLDTIGVKFSGSLTNVQIENCSFSDFTSNQQDTTYTGLALQVLGAGSGSLSMTDCTISNNNTGLDGGADGVGMYVHNLDSMTLTNVNFSNNIKGGSLGELYGGALYVGAVDDVLITGCEFSANGGDPDQGRGRGGAIAFEGTTNALIEDCSFVGNYLESSLAGNTTGGAAVSISAGGAIINIDRCEFVGNTFTSTASAYGGAIHAYDGSLAVSNSLFYDNTAGVGGAAYLRGSGKVLRNCTIVENTATEEGGGVELNGGGTVENCIVYNNTALIGTNIRLIEAGTVKYSCMNASWAGEGNLAADPLFVDAANDDFRIDASSPCVNAGANALWMDGVLDLDAATRVFAQRVDMGAYEAFGVGIADADADNDGIGDFDELTLYGTDADNDDSDSDGMKDGDETVAGTDPADASSVFKLAMTLQSDGDLQFEWPEALGRVYYLYGTDDLSDPESWIELANYSGVSDGTRSITHTPGDDSRYFYKLEVEIETSTPEF